MKTMSIPRCSEPSTLSVMSSFASARPRARASTTATPTSPAPSTRKISSGYSTTAVISYSACISASTNCYNRPLLPSSPFVIVVVVGSAPTTRCAPHFWLLLLQNVSSSFARCRFSGCVLSVARRGMRATGDSSSFGARSRSTGFWLAQIITDVVFVVIVIIIVLNV